jgi:hypothetical protein
VLAVAAVVGTSGCRLNHLASSVSALGRAPANEFLACGALPGRRSKEQARHILFIPGLHQILELFADHAQSQVMVPPQVLVDADFCYFASRLTRTNRGQ